MKIIVILSLLFVTCLVQAQQEPETLEGTISYVSSQNVYVRFASTRAMSIGDTLYLNMDGQLRPALVISQKSSISCVCKALSTEKFTPDINIYFPLKESTKKKEEIVTGEVVVQEKKLEAKAEPQISTTKTIQKEKDEKDKGLGQKISGKLSLSSYNSFQSNDFPADPRMRYTFSMRGKNVADSRFHFDTYVSFRHTINEWQDVQENLNSALKIYNLALSYEGKSFDVIMGRKINPKISNIGAIDGLQYIHYFKHFSVGTLIGTRPDHFDYGFNANLPEAGLFVEHKYKANKGSIRSTLGVFEQRLGSQTDRRYLYFQHSNSLINKLFLFGSFELDLFENIDGKQQNTFRLTSLYASARYRVSRKLDLFASYDNRRNVIYYESYKNAIDRLIEQETRQGLRFRIIIRPARFISSGLSASIRYQPTQAQPSMNANAYVNFTRIPWIKTSASLSYTYLDTYYLNSQIYGIRMNRDFFKGKLGSSLNYRFVQYKYDYGTLNLHHHIAGLNLNWRIIPLLNLSLNYETTIDVNNQYHRTYVKLIQRFK